jgi:hypothetical protein
MEAARSVGRLVTLKSKHPVESHCDVATQWSRRIVVSTIVVVDTCSGTTTVRQILGTCQFGSLWQRFFILVKMLTI